MLLLHSGSWSASNYKESKGIMHERHEFEKYKLEQISKLEEEMRTLSAEKQKFEEKQSALEADKKRLIDSQEDLKHKESQLTQVAEAVSKDTLIVQEEKEIDKLIREFTSLGINLRGHAKCDDSEFMKRYNRAQIVLSEIESKANAIGKYSKYQSFIRSHKRGFTLLPMTVIRKTANADCTSGVLYKANA